MGDDERVNSLPESGAGQPANAATNSSPHAAKGIAGFLQSLPNWPWLLGLLLAAGTIIAYQPAWRAGFIWDDDVYVTNNPLLSAPDGLKRIWFSMHSHSQYCPLVITTFRFECMLWGLNSVGYHVVNILLHSANALLVWAVLRRLALPGAWLAAAIFALHPVQVESVAWITERKNVLSLFFYLLALLAWVEFVEERPNRLWRFYVLALIFYALALFSKTTACTLPAALLLVLWLKGKTMNRFRLARIVPFIALGVGLGLVSVWWERHLGNYLKDVGQSFSGLERLLIATRALWFYAVELVWPTKLTFSYPRWEINSRDPLQYVWLIGCVAVALLLWRRRNALGRGPVAALVFFVAALSPLLGFIPVYTFRYSFVADHYQYVASVGPLALAATCITTALGLVEKGKPFLKPFLCGTLLLVLGALTWRQSAMYADVETLWRTTIERNPDSYLAHNNFGNVLFRKGQVNEAIAHYQKALAILPDYSEAHYNFGMALIQNGRVDEAIAHFEKAAETRPDSQGVQAMAHNNLGDLLSQRGQADEAIAHFQKAIQIDPRLASAHAGLGDLLLRKGRAAEAVAHYQTAMEIQPADARILNNLAWVLATCPDASVRNGAEAVQLAERACALTAYKETVFVGTLAAAYAEWGEFGKAVETSRKACELATTLGETNLLQQNEELLRQFKNREPYRERD